MSITMQRIWKRDAQQEVILKLQKMRQQIYSNNIKEVISSVKDKDIVLFIGNTRCGKSTLVNYVIGNQLNAVKKKTGRQYFISKQDDSKGPAIGSGSSSETTLPSVYPSSKINGLVVDAPGFDDNRGEAQDVANSFYIKEIINNAASVKFALITDIADIKNDNIGHFIDFIDKIFLMLPHNGNLHKGMVMIFNKDNEDYTRKDIEELFVDKILSQKVMQIKNRQLVDYLKRNLNQVVIAKMPKKAGIIDGSEVFGDLIETIKNNTVRISKREISVIVPGISDKSRAFLLEAHRYLTEMKEFDEVLREATEEFKKDFLTKYNVPRASGTSEEAKQLNRELYELETKMKTFLKEKHPFSEKLKQLKMFAPKNKMLEENSELYMKFKFVFFIDGVLNIKESEIFDIKIDAALSNMLDHASFARVVLQERMMDISQEEASRKMNEIAEAHKLMVESLKKQIDELKQHNQEMIQKQSEELGIFGKAGRAIDSFFTMIGNTVSGWFA